MEYHMAFRGRGYSGSRPADASIKLATPVNTRPERQDSN
jgi:hypothetical protein